MRTSHKLILYGLSLSAVLAISVAAGWAAAPTGLSNAEPARAEHKSGMKADMVAGLSAAAESFRIEANTRVVPAGVPSPYGFRIVGAGGAVTDFDVEHTKRMHVIVVRRDFVGFQHVHPHMAPDGTWWLVLDLPDAGDYRVFADFVVDGQKQTLATDLFVPGDFRPEPFPEPERESDADNGYTVELSGAAVVGEESTLEFVVRHDGDVVDDLSEYLGARGHLVALRDGDLGYLHVHADEERLAFEADFPTAGDYRLFLQFRHGGKVRTAAFTVHAEEAS